jgi:ribose 5-phosphate isomerase B
MAANKIPGIRAALSTDAETARLARVWNHANVLVLSNRLLTEASANEILTAWFDDKHEWEKGTEGVKELTQLENGLKSGRKKHSESRSCP